MKRIILPTDFSTTSINAIRFALQLYKDEECTFYLMNTYTPAVYQAEYVLHSPGQIGLGDTYQSESEEHLNSLRDSLLKEFDNPAHTIINHSAYNTLVEEVNSMTENEEADLVIMGTQGATGAKEVFLGTHTVHMIQKSICPVMAIPEDYQYSGLNSILFPTDFEIDYGSAQLHDLISLAKRNNSHVHILHLASSFGLSGEQLENRKTLKHLLGDIPHTFHDEEDNQIIEGIYKFQKEHKVDLKIMIQNKHTFLERLFLEPIIKKIGYHLSLPFMVIPTPST